MADELQNLIVYLEKVGYREIREDNQNYLLEVFQEYKDQKDGVDSFKFRLIQLKNIMNSFYNVVNFSINNDIMDEIREDYPKLFEVIRKEGREIKIHTVSEVAKKLRISRPAVYNLIDQGKLKGMKMKLSNSSRPTFRIDDDDLKEYIDYTKVKE